MFFFFFFFFFHGPIVFVLEEKRTTFFTFLCNCEIWSWRYEATRIIYNIRALFPRCISWWDCDVVHGCTRLSESVRLWRKIPFHSTSLVFTYHVYENYTYVCGAREENGVFRIIRKVKTKTTLLRLSFWLWSFLPCADICFRIQWFS